MCRLGQPRRVIRVTVLPPDTDAVRIVCLLADHPQWSAYWDKKHGLWRVAEDDPDSGPVRGEQRRGTP